VSRRKSITVLVDRYTVPAEDPEFRSPEPTTQTEYHVIEALRGLGYAVEVLPLGESVSDLVARLERARPRLVFNLTEEFYGDRCHDRNVAALLELMRIPFTGTGAGGLTLCRDKGLCKRLLNAHRVRVPEFLTCVPGYPVKVSMSFPFPAVVKPLFGDGSDGISNASVVENAERLVQRVQFVHGRIGQPAIVEEYIEGREIYVTVLGNRRLRVLPPRELRFNRKDGNAPLLSTYYVKFNDEYRRKWQIEFGDAELDAAIAQNIARTCKRVYRALQIRDYGRIDLRLTPQGKAVVLEANPNPDLAYGEEVAEAAEKAGIAYDNLIERIVRAGLDRRP